MSRFCSPFRAAASALLLSGGLSFAQTPAPIVPLTPCPPTPCEPGSAMPIPSPTPNPVTPAPLPPTAVEQAPSPFALGDGPSFADALGGAGAGETIALGGYIDQARPVTMFRFRYDSAYRDNRPDRATYFYAQCGCFGSPTAKGPPLPGETGIDYQQLDPYFEYALGKNLSLFTTIPVRFVNPDVNANAAGLSDISFGLKYAFINNDCRVYSFQLRTIAPSGDGRLGLGTETWWIEPGILFLEQFTPRWGFFGQVKDQIALDPVSSFTGNVMNYGLGTSYIVAQGRRGYIAPVAEFVGWTVFGGQQLTEAGAQSADGDTIVNAKFGVRIGIGGPARDAQLPTASDLYIGYGRALTGEVWYKDILRLEWRTTF